VVSDFTGAQRASRFTTLSFVIAPVESMAYWDRDRREVRHQYRLGNRRVAYSKLNDDRKRRAIGAFCQAANAMHGLSVTILIDKEVKSLFTSTGKIVPIETPIGGKTFSGWKPEVFERVLRACYLLSIFVAGVSSPGQEIVWVTDEDEIAPNASGLEDLTQIFANILCQVASHRFGKVRVGTTGTVTGDELLLEDLVAVCDLIAGSVNELVCSYGPVVPLHSFVSLAPNHLSSKSHALISSLFRERVPLRKLIFTIEATDDAGRLLYGCPTVQLHRKLVQ
jgi:hypothetical protein